MGVHAKNYSHTTFYKIYCKNNPSLCYVGHTAVELRERIHQHKSDYRRHGKYKLYKTILANGGWEQFTIEVIEVVKLNDHLEAINREQHWCHILHPTLNAKLPSFVSFDGEVFYTKTTNKAVLQKEQTNFRQRKEREELFYLRDETKRLRELLINTHLIRKANNIKQRSLIACFDESDKEVGDEAVNTLSKNDFNLEDKNYYLTLNYKMTNIKETLAKTIKNNRPKLSDKSVSAYVSTLYNIPKKLDADVKNIDIDWYKQYAGRIVDLMEEKPATSRKSVLSALFILTGLDDIHDKMIVDAKSVNELYKKQKMSVSQEENWMDWTQILEKYNEMRIQADLLFKKKTLSPDEFGELNKFMLFSCYVLFPPRRILDFAVMKIRNYDKETENFIEKGSWTFNVYKTAKVYGRQSFPISKEFQQLIKKWMKINETDYLIVNTNKKPYTTSGIGKTLNSIFGKNISCDILRHSFLTHTYSGKMPTLLEMEDIAKKLGHSVNQSMMYIKHE